jgi:AIR synthase-related protein
MTPSPAASPLAAMVHRLRAHPGLRHKTDIQRPAAFLEPLPFPVLGPAGALGDDAALLPETRGRLLLACEGMDPDLVATDPWFAGWSGVLVNLSDIAAMGGRPLAVVNSLWSCDAGRAERTLAGMRFAADTFAVPVVGGHTNLHSPYDALSVAVLGSAIGPVLSARQARPGDPCWLLINLDGVFRGGRPFWDAATGAPGERLRQHLALLAELAEQGVAHAAKDISMGGLVGTAVMFAEAAGCGLRLDLDGIIPPAGTELERWLTCFPSYGFLLAVSEPKTVDLMDLTAPYPELYCQPIGAFTNADEVELRLGGEGEALWRQRDGLTGFGPIREDAATSAADPHA